MPTGHLDSLSECESNDPATKVLVVTSQHGPPRFCCNDGGDGGAGLSQGHDEYIPEALTTEQREEVHFHNVQAL